MDSMINEIHTSNDYLLTGSEHLLSSCGFNKEFNTSYDCLQEGYMESQKILKDLGKNVVNDMNIIVKFTCKEQPSKTI